MKKIGILGGTFNPPHVGHLIAANEVLGALKLDEVRFMPNSIPPHKRLAGHVPDEHRLRMTELAIEDNEAFSTETIELERAGVSYTIETMRELIKQEPDSSFYFIIGADMIEYLPNWKDIDELTKLVTFVGVKRPGYSTLTPYPVTLVETPEIHLSSTVIRNKAASNETLRYLLPEPVIGYIKENGIYGSGKGPSAR
ncbi:nicotinate-nucleotide adenylyltransferase [Domibacillus enclensis]|uniref:Probable nicotinate-nucleotide adenylyltransferase n=1 Tax=Domibacillus enclensis TaxID=1017273 RepID=A0A1N6PSV2_9BACI|nr:nicotinate-nucleotide adenylyltransferase [Domibacillus enclensis]OXS80471.1 nicotinate-nicotinamide nucleotide adenylyltransferase [Domibacillus enclensis]SIQ07403.1 nicotinate-nucleotide adenylyltransferase [Domibacillus enclensis]